MFRSILQPQISQSRVSVHSSSFCPRWCRACGGKDRLEWRQPTAKQLTRRLAVARKSRELAKQWHRHSVIFDRVHLVTLLHRCASLTVQEEFWAQDAVRVLTELVRNAPASGPQAVTAREIANALWAAGRLQWSCTCPMVVSLTSACAPQFGAFKPQELANTTWALARLAQSDPRFLGTIAEHCAAAVPVMMSQHHANVSWAFGVLQSPQRTWFTSLAEELLRSRALPPPRHLVNVLWGFARVRMRHVPLFKKLSEVVAVEKSLEEWSGQDLAGIVWAYASLEVVHGDLFRRVSAEVSLRGRSEALSEFGAQELQNIAWAFAVATRMAREKDCDFNLAFGNQSISRSRRLGDLEKPDSAAIPPLRVIVAKVQTDETQGVGEDAFRRVG